MNRRLTPLAGAFLVLASSLVAAQSSVPVIDRSGSGPAVPARPVATAKPQPVQLAPQPNNQLAELLMTIDQLQEEVRFLRGRVEEQGHEIKQMRTDQRDRYRDLDRRISLLTKRLSDLSAAPQAALAPLPSVSAAAVGQLSLSSSPVGAVSDSEAYRQAFAHVRQRDFDRALAAFADFERTHAGSELLGNVYYWTGEVHRAKPQPDQQQARQAYQRLLERFPGHPKAPEATYKLGLTYDAQGESSKAQEMMQVVISRYPDQQPARLARDFLSQN